MSASETLIGRILIADDESRNLFILEELLEDFELETASSGSEAMEKLPRFHPDLVLLDVMMPDLDGFEVCRRIRASEEHRFTKVIFVSGKAMIEERLAGYEAGGDDYVTKPFDLGELMAKVRSYLRLKHVEEVNQIKGDFLTLIAHETGTPLTGILGNADFILQQPNIDRGEILACVQDIRASGEKLLRFVEKTKLVCQLKSKPALHRSLHGAREIVQPVVQAVETVAALAGVRIEAQCADGMIACDPDLLSKSLLYVLENAIRFSPKGEVVEIMGEKDSAGQNYSLAVVDRGPGIKPGSHEKIFSEFAIYDVDHHSQGQGLSLALAKRVAALHGGDLQVESDEGQGAKFIFQLPVTESSTGEPEEVLDKQDQPAAPR